MYNKIFFVCQDVANSPDSVDNEACNNLQGKMMTLRDELTLTQEQLKKLETEMKRKDEDLRRKTEELASLTSKVKVERIHFHHLSVVGGMSSVAEVDRWIFWLEMLSK